MSIAWLGALRAVTVGDFRRNGLAIGDHPVNHPARCVMLDSAQMIGQRIAGSFAGLGHKVSDIDARRFRFADRVHNFADKQVGKNAGVEGTGAEKNQIGFLDRFNSFVQWANGTRQERQFLDGLVAGSDARLAVHLAAALQRGDQGHIRDRRREDTTADSQNLAADADGFSEIAGHMRERSEKKIAKIVADEAATGVKAILEEATQQCFVLRKSDHTVADVAGRKNAVLAAQTSGAAAVVGNRNDGSEVAYRLEVVRGIIPPASDVFLEATQKSRKAGA